MSDRLSEELVSTIKHFGVKDVPFVLEFRWCPKDTGEPETLQCIESGFSPVVVDGELVKDDCGHYDEHLWYRVCVS